MDDDLATWPQLHAPEGQGDDRRADGQRRRLRAAIDRLQQERERAPAGTDDDADRRAAQADMLSLLIALQGEARAGLDPPIGQTGGEGTSE